MFINKEKTPLFLNFSAFPFADALGRIVKEVVAMNITTRRLEDEAFEKLFTHAPIGIFIAKGKKIELVNPGFQQITGYSEAELMAMEPLTMVVPEFKDQVREKAIRTLKGECSLPYEFPFITKSGEEGWAMGTVASTLYQGERATLAYFMDITMRKRAEEALKESEHKYRELVENANSIILRLTKDGKITFINEFGQKFFGYTEEEIIGRHVIGTIVPENESTGRNLKPMMTEICADPKKFENNVNENIRRNGERVWVAWTNKMILDNQGQLAEILSIGSDITERKRAEEALEQRTEELTGLNALAHRVGACLSLEELVAAALDPTVYTVMPDQTLLYVREADHLALQGTRPDRLLLSCNQGRLRIGECLCGLALQEEKSIYSPNIHADTRCSLTACKEAGVRSFAALTLVSGEQILGVLGLAWAEVQDLQGQARFLETVAGEIAMGLHNALLYRELQDHARELDHRVRERTLQLQVVNKELEAFAYSISHDLRAPLRAVSGFAQIIARRHKAALNEEGRHYVDNIVLAAERMAHLIDDLLTYSRLGRQALKIRNLDLKEVLRQVLDDLDSRVATLGAAVQVAEDLPWVPGDPTLLRQIFTNLLDNALTYRQAGVPPRIQITWRLEEDQIVLRVSDNGIGIDPAYHEKIFSVFQRLHSEDEYPGTGIGLAIVKKSVIMLGGQVWVESELGKGSTFYLKIPKE
ncbi:MAG: PAS domain-containing sensor histidine kinase [Thermodesulfobacteriota bacterium]